MDKGFWGAVDVHIEDRAQGGNRSHAKEGVCIGCLKTKTIKNNQKTYNQAFQRTE